ncbi:MAG: glycine cleavage T C-terminal barrel domain-containing protein [Pirellulales bacterium]
MSDASGSTEAAAIGPGGAAPLDFGDQAAEYAALTTGAGLVDLQGRTRIELMGEDRSAYLHNLSTNEIRKLPVGQGCEAFLLDAKGHVIGHVLVICGAESLVLDTVAGQEQRLLAHLDRYLIRERVELHGRGDDWAEWLIAGSGAAALLSRLGAELPGSRAMDNVEAALAGRPVGLVRVPWTQPGGFLVLCRAGDRAGVEESLCAAGAARCGAAALEMARVEAGFPWYGWDIDDRNLPQEVARDQLAISFVKGCYIGQETVARIDALGHVNRTLVGVRFFETQLPAAGTPLTREGNDVGQVTSAAFSPRLKAPLALAYVRRGSNAPGTQLEWPQGRAEVVSLPLVDKEEGGRRKEE